MRKFTTILFALAMCLTVMVAIAVGASAAENENPCIDGHGWTAWTTVTAPTCQEPGQMVRTCVCGIAPEYKEIAPIAHTIEHVEAVEPGCETEGNIEYWYCTECGYAWQDAELTQVTNLLSVKLGAACKLEKVEAVAPTCLDLGNIEYYVCSVCGRMENADGMAVNALSVILPVLDHTIVHVDAVAPDCGTEGNIEYWYCSECGYAWEDAELTKVTNLLSVKLGAVCPLVYVDAIPACHNNGVAEYWYCPKCDAVYADAAGTQLTNRLNLTVLGDLSKLEHHAEVPATATEDGMKEYWYCAGCDCYFTDAEGKYNVARLSLVIPATGEVPGTPENPDTADSAIFYVIALAVVATAGAAAIVYKKRENN